MPISSRRPISGQCPTSGRHHTPMPTSSWRHTPVDDHTMEEASQTADEICLDTGYDMGFMAHDDAGKVVKIGILCKIVEGMWDRES